MINITLDSFLEFIRQGSIGGTIAILILFFVIGIIAKYIIRFLGNRIATRTETDLDDKIIHALENPLLTLIMLAGVFIAILSINLLDSYTSIIIKVAIVTAAIIITYIFVRIINLIIKHHRTTGLTLVDKKIDMKYSKTVARVVDIIIWAVALTFILIYLGVEITPLLGALGVGGIALALAMQDTLTNFFAGFYVITEKQIGIGDYVEIKSETEVEGFVEDISWRTTKIRSMTNTRIIIPNSKFSQSVVTNYTRPDKTFTIVIPVGITYDSNLHKAEKIAFDLAEKIMEKLNKQRHSKEHDVQKKESHKKEDETEDDFKKRIEEKKHQIEEDRINSLTLEPFVSYKEFGDSSINIRVGLRMRDVEDRFQARHLFIKGLKKEYDKNKISFAFPTRTIHLKQDK